MSKFNLKDYKKIDGDEHIDRRLQESHQTAPDQINEAQLEDYRANSEPEVLIEKLLDSKRLGSADEITERRLDDHKATFANKYRNPEAYTGDINKLEEKRLKNDPVEKEKYEVASECAKQMRWWEGVKSPDGLKVAKTEAIVKTAQVDEMEADLDEEDPVDFNIVDEDKLANQIAEEPVLEDVKPTRSISESDVKNMDILKWKEVPNVKNPEMSGVYVVLSFDPEVFNGDEERIKEAAMDKVISVNDYFSGKIYADNFFDVQEEGGEGTVRMTAIGPEFTSEAMHPVAAPAPADPTGFLGEGNYSEVGYQEKDVDGTPMAIGKVVLAQDLKLEDMAGKNMAQLLKDVVDFIKSRHPHLQINEESLDLIDLESKGEISYAVGIMPPKDDFPVVEASSKKK